MLCERCPQLKRIIITQFLLFILINIAFIAPNFFITNDMHNDILEIEKSIDGETQSISSLTNIITKNSSTLE